MEEKEEKEEKENSEELEVKKKTVLRGPPRAVELTSTLDRIKTNKKLGQQKHYFYVRIILIITGIISLGFGIYIFIKFEDFFSKSFNFNYRLLLLIFFYIYSPSGIGIFLVSFILSLIVYLFFCLCGRKKIHGAPLYNENDITMTVGSFKDNEDDVEQDKSKVEIREEYIGINADKITLLPYTLTIFVIMAIVFYFAALPLSIILLINLWKNQIYKDLIRFWALYVFLLANFINGLLIVFVFFHMFFVKRIENSILKRNMDINENKIKALRNEVREALKKPK